MKVVVGQGNPGSRYGFTRHNAGFLALDFYAKVYGLEWKMLAKFDAMVAESERDGEKVLLVKPQEFYNLTGLAVQKVLQFYKLSTDDILVVCDDLNLEFGTVRTRMGGSDGGNNGLKSVVQQIGTEFARIRIGTSNEQRTMMSDADFVLAKFTDDEKKGLPMILDEAKDMIDMFLDGKFEAKKVAVK